MNEIENVTIQPNTQGSESWIMGQDIGGKRLITNIKLVNDDAGTFIQIFVNKQLFVEYSGVSYAIFYKLDETK